MIHPVDSELRRLPVHQLDGPARAYACRLLHLVANIPLQGIERSIKFAPHQFLHERFLVGIAPAQWRPALLSGIATTLLMPTALQEQFAAALARANFLGLGFEQGEQRCGYRAYIEYPLLVPDSGSSDQVVPVLQYQGFKWSPEQPDKFVVTDYLWRPRLSLAGIRKQFEHHLGQSSTSLITTLLSEVLDQAALRGDAAEFVFLEVAEPGSTRQSVDLNIYSAGLLVAQFIPHLYVIAAQFGLDPQVVSPVLESAGTQMLGHVSAGCDRHGQDFLTVYFDH